MTIKYKVHKTPDGDVIACNSCGCEVATAKFDWGPPFDEKHDREKRYLCDFCSSSYVSNITRYRATSPDGYVRKEVAVLIAQAVNYLEQKLARKAKERE